MNLGKRKKQVIRTDRDKYIQTTLTSGFDRYHDNTIWALICLNCLIRIKLFVFADHTLKRISKS